MEKAYIMDGIRSFIGIENSMYRHVPAEKLGAKVLEKLAVPYKEHIDLIITGNAVGCGGNISRLISLEAGLPEEIPAFTIDLQCGSGLEALILAAAKIKSGQADLVIAGGAESSSTAPRRAYHKNHPDYEKYGGENSFYHVARFSPGEHNMLAMIEGAERTAASAGITREDLNPHVLKSHALAKEARENGFLKEITTEIIEGCEKDEGIRDRMSERLLNRVPCILKNGQVITSANACLTNDGAAYLVLASGHFVKEHALSPRAELVDAAEIGGNPAESPRTAVSAIEKLLAQRKMTEEDISVFECNEAFAVIDELFFRRFPKAADRYNIFGGALAYGHPYGASGGIITLHALQALKKTHGEYAICSIAAAGGIGTALLIKNMVTM